MPARPNPARSVRKLPERTNSWVKLMIVLTLGVESQTNVLEQRSTQRVPLNNLENALSEHASCRYRPEWFVHRRVDLLSLLKMPVFQLRSLKDSF